MGYFIGPDSKGYKAEVKINDELKEQKFKTFGLAVEWVEQLKKEEITQNEIGRSKKENT